MVLTAMTWTEFLAEAVQLLVGAITGVATGIGGGLSSLVTALVYNADQTAMSPFIAIIFIFGGISLAFGLSRWVVNLVSSLGARNR